jgi:hypothetical protein
MTNDGRFSHLVSLLAASDLAEWERRSREQLDAEGIAGAARAFQETKEFLGALEVALKAGVDRSITLTTDGEWIPSNGRDYWSKLQLAFWNPGDSVLHCSAL